MEFKLLKWGASLFALGGFGYFCHQKYKENLNRAWIYSKCQIKTLLPFAGMTIFTLYISPKKMYTLSTYFFTSLSMTEMFLAQFWGLIFIIMSVGMFVRRENVRSIVKMAQDEGLLVFSGFLGVMIGVGHILLFNEWSSDWTIIITLIGWISLAKGIIRVFAPKWTQKFVKDFHSKSSNTTSILVIVFILGLYLAVKGFGL